jgi:cyclohexanecarboxylate-CoA ligase
MTENSAVTLIRLDDPDGRAFGTDGLPLEGVEVKIESAAGGCLPHGESGRLLVRACAMVVPQAGR